MSSSGPPPDSVQFELAALALRIERMDGSHRLLDSQVNQSIQNMGSTLQALQAVTRENSVMLTELRERSSGLERLASAVEKGSGLQGVDVKALQLSVAEWKGLVRGVFLCGAVVIASVTAYVLYRFDRTDTAVQQLQSELRSFMHPGGKL